MQYFEAQLPFKRKRGPGLSLPLEPHTTAPSVLLFPLWDNPLNSLPPFSSTYTSDTKWRRFTLTWALGPLPPGDSKWSVTLMPPLAASNSNRLRRSRNIHICSWAGAYIPVIEQVYLDCKAFGFLIANPLTCLLFPFRYCAIAVLIWVGPRIRPLNG